MKVKMKNEWQKKMKTERSKEEKKNENDSWTAKRFANLKDFVE